VLAKPTQANHEVPVTPATTVASHETWPELSFAAWKDTCQTLHLWTQIVGKIRLAQTPWLNHSWHVTLYVTPRGLTTSPIPHGSRAFELSFDFVDHRLRVQVDDGTSGEIPLEPKSVAQFRSELLELLTQLDLPVRVSDMPNEIPDVIRFSQDRSHAAYDREYANRFGRVLVQADRIFKHFRTGFLGKSSPVHFFWGSFDLAVTRFSGRPAPLHPGGVPNLPDSVAAEAYSHEVSSAGFWPGNADVDAVFYAYAYPAPKGFSDAVLRPSAAYFHPQLQEFVLPYASVRSAADPERALLDFLQSSYEAAANPGHWDRAALECDLGRAGVPRRLERA
jgi:hypothetical protein